MQRNSKNGKIKLLKNKQDLIHESENAIIKDCYFQSIPDAIEFISMKNSLIRGNTFFNIKDDAIDLNHSENILVDSNYISKIEDRGFEIGAETFGQSKNIKLKHNIIIDCDEAVTFKEGSTGEIINCTLYENRIGITCIEDVAGSGGSKVLVENTIISGSLEKDIDKDGQSTVDISYSLSDLGWLTGNNNLFNNPEFISPPEGNFNLMKASSCVDAGNPASPIDPDDTRADIGALYRDINTGNHDKLHFNDQVRVYPNPFVDELFLEFDPWQKSRISCEIFDLDGHKIATVIDNKDISGNTVFHLKHDQLINWPQGNLVLLVSINKSSQAFKIIHASR